MKLLGRLQGLLKRLVNDKPHKRDGDILRFVKSVSLNCVRCRGMAPPVKGTTEQYRCTKCEKQFSGPPHQIDQAIWRASRLTAKQKVDLKNNYEVYAGQSLSPDDI
jgi:hypothetical protein